MPAVLGDVEFFRQLVERAPDGIVVVDQHGIIRLVNERSEELFGWSRQDLVGRPVESLVPDRAAATHSLHRSVFADSPRTRPMGEGLELSALRADGSEIPVDISLGTVETVDGTWFFAAVRDATARKQAESELLSASSHLRDTVAKLERHGEELRLLGEMRDRLQSGSDPDDARRVAASALGALVPQTEGSIYGIGTTDVNLRRSATWGEPGPDSPTFVAVDSCWALRRQRPHLGVAGAGAARCRHADYVSEGWTLCVPLVAHGDVNGLIHLTGVDGTVEDLVNFERLAVSVSDHLSLALAGMELRDSLLMMSERDALTGLYNRRRLDQAFAQSFDRGEDEANGVCLMLVDVDDFKKVNDSRGHVEGDLLLVSLSRVLQNAARSGDVVCRIGGDEFAILLRDCPVSTARDLGERIRATIEDSLSATVSLGVATLAPGLTTLEQLVARADEFLYEAKTQGKNRVVAPSGGAAKP